MKKYSTLAEILLAIFIFTVYLLPPVFISSVSSSDVFTRWDFPYSVFFNFIFCLFLFVLHKTAEKKLGLTDVSKNKYYFFYNVLFPLTFTACVLFTCGLIFKFLSVFLSVLFSLSEKSQLSVEIPTTIIQWIFCILNFIFASFTEEFFYRFYFPEALLRFFSKFQSDKLKKVSVIIAEFFVLILFAFAHRYEGFLSVLNAAVAHVVLRKCLKKYGNLWAGFGAHFIYNIISLILL